MKLNALKLSIFALLILISAPVFAADPTSISGLDLWLKADTGVTLASGRVSAWADQSGAGNNVTQATTAAQPAYISGPDPAISFEASNNWLSIPTTLSVNTQAQSCFMVVEDRASLQSSECYFEAGSANQFSFLAQGLALNFYNGSSFITTTLYPKSNREMVGFTSTTTGSVFYDGYNSQAAAATSAGTVTGGQIGGLVNGTAGASWLYGNVREVVHYSRSLSTTEVLTLQNYFARKYNFAHEAKNNLAAAGDSITSGVNAQYVANWVNQMRLPTQTWQARNFGFAGIQLSTLITEAASKIDPVYDATKNNYLIVFAGTNDISSTVGNQTGATAYSRLVTYCQARQAVGWKVIVVLMLPRTGNGGSGGAFETDRVTFNNSVKAAWPTFCSAIVDPTADTRIGLSSGISNLTYWAGDSIHLTNNGYGVLSGYILPVLNAVASPAPRPVGKLLN